VNLLAIYTQERAHLARLAGQMASAKLDEQRSLLGEKTIEKLELALTGILRDLGRDPSDAYVRRVIARRLRAVGGSAEETTTTDAQIVIDAELPEVVAF
jgi:hypothetical protein